MEQGEGGARGGSPDQCSAVHGRLLSSYERFSGVP
jgi:hypothetical protein